MCPDLPFEIQARHTGRENVLFIASVGGREVDTDRYRIGDAKARRRLALRWGQHRQLRNGQDIPPVNVEARLLEIEQSVRHRLDRGNGETASSTQPSRLLAIAENKAELFHNEMGNGYASVPVGGHVETYLIRSRAFKQWLSREYYEAFECPPGTHGLVDAVNVIDGMAVNRGVQIGVSVRMAERVDGLFVDLGNALWRCVHVTPDGWSVVSEPGVKFFRPPGLKAFPTPEHGGSVELLRDFINVRGDEEFMLMVGWILGVYLPVGPYPILIVNGEQGSAKSTTSRVLRELADANLVPLRSPPRSERDLVIAAQNNLVLALDNLSHVPEWLSDSLCRLASGGGFGTRALFSDGEEFLFTGARPILLNGIGDVATRGDLIDRSIHVTLPAIDEIRRTDESSFWARFREVQPWILGVIFDAVAAALRNRPNLVLKRLTRMADFSRWVESAAPALGWSPGTFLDAFSRNRAEANDLALSSSPVAEVLLRFVRNRTEWEGRASELLDELTTEAPENVRKGREWPKNASQLGTVLRRLAPNLRETGIRIEFSSAGGGRQKRRSIRISACLPIAGPGVPAVPTGDPRPSSVAEAAPEERGPNGPPSPTRPRGGSVTGDHAEGDGWDGGDGGTDTANKAG